MHAISQAHALEGPNRRTRKGTAGLVLTLLAVLVAVLAFGTPAAHAAARRPVIILTGLGGEAAGYSVLADRLTRDGYTVDVFELPDRGNGAIHVSAVGLAARVDQVLARTGSDKVDLLGHSLGGLVARDYVRFTGGGTKVDKLITLGTPNQGTWAANGMQFLTPGTCLSTIACGQMAVGSSYLNALNQGDDAVGAVRYWTFASHYDEFVYPSANAFLQSTTGRVVNVAVQDQCWGRVLGHLALTSDLTVYSGLTQALAGWSRIWLNCWTPTVGAI
jgi:triacylglycerol esterase/lipase EstA (alpha/beta hydrolase family)